ncbi:restriction endonuclease subunit S [Chryseobacterium tructae]|uniref:Restriction endonuclease subunit S n=1 Tax=Chryseobacterium tructae TaxID=1037380 RepID=A0ABV7XV32_9FLAO|nr:restriction endonuclease subunit S [Chryseobacterium tructae]MDN3692106.1 restriction endonuclease subunit S [Chryseobacterium tructae]
MTKENKSVKNFPNLRFPGFEEEWEEKMLGNLGTFSGGGTPTSSNEKFWNGNIPWISSSDLEEDNILKINISRFITQDAIEKSATKLCKAPSVLIVSRVGVGKVALSLNDICTSQDFTNISELKCNQLYLAFQLSKVMKKAANEVQGTSIKGISSSEIKSKKIYLPLIIEQEKIALFFEKIEERIQTQKKIIEDNRKMKLELSHSLFTRSLKINQRYISKWEEKKLGDISTILMGQSPDSLAYNTDGKGLPLIQGNADIVQRFSEPRQFTSQITKTCDIGDIILTVRAPVGYVAKSKHFACIGRGVCTIKSNEKSDSEFIYQFLLYFENKWASFEQGSTFTSVNSSDIKVIKLNIPTIKEQKEIAQFLKAFDEKINLENELLTQYENQKKYLLQNLFV